MVHRSIIGIFVVSLAGLIFGFKFCCFRNSPYCNSGTIQSKKGKRMSSQIAFGSIGNVGEIYSKVGFVGTKANSRISCCLLEKTSERTSVFLFIIG